MFESLKNIAAWLRGEDGGARPPPPPATAAPEVDIAALALGSANIPRDSLQQPLTAVEISISDRFQKCFPAMRGFSRVALLLKRNGTFRKVRQGHAWIETIGTPLHPDEHTNRQMQMKEFLGVVFDFTQKFRRKVQAMIFTAPVIDANLSPIPDISSKQWLFARFLETDPAIAATIPGPRECLRQPLTSQERMAADSRKSTWRARRGFADRRGHRWAIDDRNFVIEGNLECLPQIYEEYLAERQLMEKRHCSNSAVLDSSMQSGIGAHLGREIKTINFFSVVRLQDHPTHRPAVGELKWKEKLSSSMSTLGIESAKRREANAAAERGYRDADGEWLRWVEYIAPTDMAMTTGQKDEMFCRILNEVDERYEHLETTKLIAAGREWSTHVRPTEDGKQPEKIPGFRYWALIKGKETDIPPGVEPLPEAPEPRAPVTTCEIIAEGMRQENLPCERGVVNQFGEGWAVIDYWSAPTVPGELTYEEQNDEFLRRRFRWKREHPGVTILEEYFHMDEGEIMRQGVKGCWRRMFIRYKVNNFNPADATPECQISAVTSQEVDRMDQLIRSRELERGHEDADGNGFAYVELIAPSPGPGHPNPRETTYQSLLLLNNWSYAFPGREIIEVQPWVKWSSHSLPNDPLPGFAYGMLIRFKRRGGAPGEGVMPPPAPDLEGLGRV